ncbi:MAG: hypothetical protein A2931_03515 [Candidatus Niyogibacteria bacterium RIFCSPLOWO2_01_FULL_45_48]|uniref:DUF4446 domain-containing protein n=2 Tax=Candidatus Niyogiibacteriota TaxID=1817912 RepID=A0A1G2EXT2_9BACT|nr:MAG: hypothetical protein A2931_03515 [Candidatus Niyogibacteria bacterium RIFCSPLOWO2_01_FULL_45_48]OGZ30527.1 MAG: hypothetical protein A3J00_03575 [Candidatus Niyogibacteria bacterium RIFCSPLOWO2_02_FULL_45_13]
MIFGRDFLFWIAVASAVLSLAALVWLTLLQFRLKKLFRGQKAENLQNVLAEIQDSLRYFSEKEKETGAFLEQVERRIGRSAQHLGLVRFNPYEGVGGDQSFSIAVLDEQKNGFVVTGLYGRDSSRIYAKPVTEGASQYQLSDEEKGAIEKALGRYA